KRVAPALRRQKSSSSSPFSNKPTTTVSWRFEVGTDERQGRPSTNTSRRIGKVEHCSESPGIVLPRESAVFRAAAERQSGSMPTAAHATTTGTPHLVLELAEKPLEAKLMAARAERSSMWQEASAWDALAADSADAGRS